ncbi:MAG: nitrogen fixation protein NifQ [Hyphomicrobiaceae bacterium]|nr:nitrogen fixation protein NifQ [Hyphomicrobiaceae bacterium]
MLENTDRDTGNPPPVAHVGLPMMTTVLERTVLCSVLEKGLGERDLRGGTLARRIGVGGTSLGVLLMLYVPGHPVLVPDDYVQQDVSEEQAWVRDLLMAYTTPDNETSRVLAHIIARRSIEGGHLWEDLGLPDRPMLTSTMRQFFPDLAALNVDNMRWKRFFFRQLCEAEGMAHCTSPTCCTCPDVERCFEPGSVDALMARAKTPPD